MKILIYGLHFKPDLIGIGKYTGEMSDWLYENNHEIRVITAPSFYPKWKEDKKQYYYKKIITPYPVWRCPIYVPTSPSAFKRLMHYISFSIASFPILVRNLFWKPDFIITIEPPFAASFNTLFYSAISGAKSILHIQDLELDAAYSLNMLKSSFIYGVLSKIEKFILRRFKKISTISDGMKSKVIEKGIDRSKILLLPNWADIDTIKPDINYEPLRKKFEIMEGMNTVLYSGNLGEKQNLDIIISAAKYLNKVDSNIQFIFVGEGSAKNRLKKLVHNDKLSNVKFHPLQPKKDLARLLSMADIHLITQDENISDYVLPSKLTNILSAGGVTIISAKSGTQLANIVEKYSIGQLVKPGSRTELVNAIQFLLDNNDKKNILSQNARKYAEEHLDKDKILNNFISNLM